MVAITVTDGVMIASMIADIYFRAKKEGVEITVGNIVDKINEMEKRVEEKNELLGVK